GDPGGPTANDVGSQRAHAGVLPRSNARIEDSNSIPEGAMRQINRAAVIGAGTMGAAIAAHLANSGRPVLLLDAVPSEVTATEAARGLTLSHPSVRNRLALSGLERVKNARPPALFTAETARLITPGNVEDDLGRL